MGLAQPEQKEVREKEEGGSRGSGGSLACFGGRVAGSGQTSRRTGWLAGGGVHLAGPAPRDRTTLGCWLGKRPLGNLPLCLCLLGPPCLSISLSFVVRRRTSQLSGPSQQSPHSSPVRCRPPSASMRPLRCLQSLSLLVSGPLFLPISSSSPSPTQCLCLSICLSARGASQDTHHEAGRTHPVACPPGTSAAAGRGQGLTRSEWLLPGCPHCSLEGLGSQLPHPPSSAQTAGNQ